MSTDVNTIFDPAKRRLLLVYIARFIRAFGFGAVSVVFALFLQERGFSSVEIGTIVSATLIEDAFLTTFVSVYSSRFGLRGLLLLASVILCLSGLGFSFIASKWIIGLIAVFGIVSPAGYEGGPFGALEQTVISESSSVERLAHEFSIYNLTAFAGSAAGSLLAGLVFPWLRTSYSTDTAFRSIFLVYAVAGLLMLFLYACLKSNKSDPVPLDLSATARAQEKPAKKGLDLPRSPAIWRLSLLQGMDAFGGGFVPTTLISYWFFERYHAGPEFTGPVFAATYALAALSFIISPYVCRRFGLLNTMVFTHLPCSISLALVPFMPTAFLAGAILVARSLFSSMDIPARQAFSMVIVPKEERSAAAGLTSASRSLGQCAAPLISGWALANTMSGLSFQLAGGLKTIYDLVIYFSFRNVPLQREEDSSQA